MLSYTVRSHDLFPCQRSGFLKSEVSISRQDYTPLKKINLLGEFADMYVEESEVYFITLCL